MFRFWISLSSALGLGACGVSRPAYDPQQVQLRLEAQAPEAYNIVWLRATLRNGSPKRVWIFQQRDSADLTCADGLIVTLNALSPEQDSMRFCGPCPAVKPYRGKLLPLEPGAERVTYLRIDLNYLFPRRAYASVQPCGRYFNRTLGVYHFQISSVKMAQRQGGELVLSSASNTVTIYRKQ